MVTRQTSIQFDGVVQWQCKKDVSPSLTHWSYVFLALTPRHVTAFVSDLRPATCEIGLCCGVADDAIPDTTRPSRLANVYTCLNLPRLRIWSRLTCLYFIDLLTLCLKIYRVALLGAPQTCRPIDLDKQTKPDSRCWLEDFFLFSFFGGVGGVGVELWLNVFKPWNDYRITTDIILLSPQGGGPELKLSGTKGNIYWTDNYQFSNSYVNIIIIVKMPLIKVNI